MSNPSVPDAQAPDPLEIGIQWLTGALGQCNSQQEVAATIHAAQQHYGPAITTLILHESGRRFAQAQQLLARSTQNWNVAVALSGHTVQTLPGAAATIYAQQPPSNPV